MPKPDYYVDNKKLLHHLIEYKKLKKKNPHTQIDNYIAESIIKIAERYASRANFAGYTYRQDMVSDAIENVVRYIDNFNPEKSKNPFAYITQICHFAFIRRIRDEKTHTYIRFKSIQKYFFEDKLADMQDLDHSSEGVDFSLNDPLYDNMRDFIADFEREVEENKKKSKDYNDRVNKKKNRTIEFE
jgi:DNA-directed RNA polymerase specialized sigma24 family protein